MVMARLLRNRLESYVNNVNRAEGDYTAAAGTYNTALQGAMGGTTSVITDANGKQVVVGGTTLDNQLALKSDNIGDASKLPGSFLEMYVGAPVYARDADGTVRSYSVVNSPEGGLGWSAGTVLPTIPDAPEVNVPQQPNLTQSNIKELESPSADPAGLLMQQAYGMQGKSQLAGEVANSRVSAFADPEDPNDMASRGILARTMAGQLG